MGLIKRNWLKIIIIVIVVWIIILAFVWPTGAAQSIALIDPPLYDAYHSAALIGLANADGVAVTHYTEGVVIGMHQAWLDRAQVVVIPYWMGGCDDWRIGNVITELILLSETSRVYLPAVNCPLLSRWSTFTAAMDKNGNRPVYLVNVDGVEAWAYGCSIDGVCNDSEAVMRAALNQQ
jgi:hypothetical protein